MAAGKTTTLTTIGGVRASKAAADGATTVSPSGEPSASSVVVERVEHVLSLIRPAVQSDGGDLELIEVTGTGVVRIRLHGACVGCPSSTITLKAGIERNLRQHVPEVRSVEAVE